MKGINIIKRIWKIIPKFNELGEEYQIRKQFREKVGTKKNKVVLLASCASSREMAKREGLFLKLLQLDGYKSHIYIDKKKHRSILSKRSYRIFKAFNFKQILESREVLTSGDIEKTKEFIPKALIDKSSELEELMQYEYEDIAIGEFVVSSFLKEKRIGWQERIMDEDKPLLLTLFYQAFSNYLIAKKLVLSLNPDIIMMSHKGYVSYGPFFNYFLKKGIPVIIIKPCTFNSNPLLKKFLSIDEKQDTARGISMETWQKFKGVSLSEKQNNELNQFFEIRFRGGESVIPYNAGKKFVEDPRELRATLGLEQREKTAAVFPHLLWDAAFFNGTNLFLSSLDWFVETLKVARRKSNVNWIVKIHPSEQIFGTKQSAYEIAKQIAGKDKHIYIISPLSNINTYSLFPIIDCGITLRGTVGAEMAFKGIPVITGGTGHYSNKGFTIDSDTKEQYIDKLENIEKLPNALTEEEEKQARRYAYLFFTKRDTEFPFLKSIENVSEDGIAKCKIGNIPKDNLYQEESIKKFLQWVNNKERDFIS